MRAPLIPGQSASIQIRRATARGPRHGPRAAFIAAVVWFTFPIIASAHSRPATPESLWSVWPVDPLLLSGLLLSGCCYMLGARAVWRRAGYGKAIPYHRVAAFLGGLLAVAAALMSPLAGLSAALFSAHMVQHLVLILVAAPLLVVGTPVTAFLWTLPLSARQRTVRHWKHNRAARAVGKLLGSAIAMLLLHALSIWVWHLPALYDAAVGNPWLHSLEHITFLATSVLFWRIVLPVAGRRALSPGLGVLLVFVAAMQSSALGVLMLISRDAWYSAHTPHVAAWGMTPLEDQQLAGAIMWVPAGTAYAVFALYLLGRWLVRLEQTEPAFEHVADD
jgi:putative membrane protein